MKQARNPKQQDRNKININRCSTTIYGMNLILYTVSWMCFLISGRAPGRRNCGRSIRWNHTGVYCCRKTWGGWASFVDSTHVRHLMRFAHLRVMLCRSGSTLLTGPEHAGKTVVTLGLFGALFSLRPTQNRERLALPDAPCVCHERMPYMPTLGWFGGSMQAYIHGVYGFDSLKAIWQLSHACASSQALDTFFREVFHHT